MPGKGKVLIVDDDQSIVKMLNLRLQTEGYDTGLATDGKSAVKLAGKYSPDVILLDIAMPAVTGVDVLKRLARSKRGGDIPVIIITAYPHMIDDVREFDCVKGCFVKPFDMTKLMGKIAELAG